MVGYLGLDEFVKLWCEVVDDSLAGALQSHATDEQNGEDHVGEQRSEVHNLQDKTRNKSSNQILENYKLILIFTRDLPILIFT